MRTEYPFYSWKYLSRLKNYLKGFKPIAKYGSDVHVADLFTYRKVCKKSVPLTRSNDHLNFLKV